MFTAFGSYTCHCVMSQRHPTLGLLGAWATYRGSGKLKSFVGDFMLAYKKTLVCVTKCRMSSENDNEVFIRLRRISVPIVLVIK